MATRDTSQYGFTGQCTDCGGLMVEIAVTSSPDRRLVQLRCQACHTEGRFEQPATDDGGLADPTNREHVTDVEMRPVNWIRCRNCRGTGDVIGCVDDLCHAQGRCKHGGNDMCPECQGSSRVPRVAETDGGRDEVLVTDGGHESPGMQDSDSYRSRRWSV